MFVAVFLLLLFNTMVQAQYDGYNNFDPFRPDFNPIPPNLFQSGVFSPDWGTNLVRQIEQSTRQIEQAVKSAARSAVNAGGLTVNTVNGVTTVRATIGGRPYTAVFPGSSVSVSSNRYGQDGQFVEVFTIFVDGVPYTYTTVNGRTTATDGQGRVLVDGGPFRVPPS
ncbi:hypothetical protein OSTOST_05309 [Ostertagia ostertagi]